LSNSLVPGYPADESAAGTVSPTHGSCAAAEDPTQAFDGAGTEPFVGLTRLKQMNP
jgi:hypothetical protein